MKIQLIKGDITTIEVDAMINAANSDLAGGGGVDGAIHKAGGPTIMQECNDIRLAKGGCPTGQAVITTAGNLPAKNVIHTVGPIWSGGENQEPDYLRSAYCNSLKLAEDHGLAVLSFPNISTGVYGFPKDLAAKIAIESVTDFARRTKTVERVIFVCFDYESFERYKSLLKDQES